MNGFFVTNQDGARLEVFVQTNDAVVISITKFGEAAEIKIDCKQDLEELQDALRNASWELERRKKNNEDAISIEASKEVEP